MVCNLITLFTSPKAFSGHSGLIQNNALDSWQALKGVDVILFGDEDGVAEAAHSRGFRHLPRVACSEYGTPFLNDMFSQAQKEAASSLTCYVNADIILPENFVGVARALAVELPRFIGVGRRWDVDVSTRLDFVNDAYSILETVRGETGVLHAPYGLDYFIFPAGSVVDMPPFCIGRPVWDNWLFWHMKQLGVLVVDTTECLKVYHQNHDYRHIKGGNGKSYEGAPESLYNQSLVSTLEGFDPCKLTTLHADLRLAASGLRRQKILKREMWNWQIIYKQQLKNWLWRTLTAPLRKLLR
jgi:hypothetical protein